MSYMKLGEIERLGFINLVHCRYEKKNNFKTEFENALECPRRHEIWMLAHKSKASPQIWN